jgi:Na+-translocating ferredoxin:NAD+ oxidoreductase RnfD subunit
MSTTPAATRPALTAPTTDPLRIGTTVTRFYVQHLTAAVFPLTAGLFLFGWRALVAVVIVTISSLVALGAWRHVGRRGAGLHPAHAIWFSLLLAMMFPAHLAADSAANGIAAPAFILAAAGVMLVIMMWMLGGLGAGRVHPVVATYLIIEILFGTALAPSRILRRDHLFTGDLLNAPTTPSPSATGEPWVLADPPSGPYDGHHRPLAMRQLQDFTTTSAQDERYWLSLDVLLRDHLPPLEDLIVAGQPAPIGLGSAIAVIVGGLFLLYRGLIDYRIPLLMLAAAYLVLLVAPIPTLVNDEPEYRWFVLGSRTSWEVGLTFVHYELLASPLVFAAIFLATAPSIRPFDKRARAVYATVAGATSAVAQLYLSISYGPYLALLLASLLTPYFDKRIGPRPLV